MMTSRSFKWHLTVSAVLRLVLIAYGHAHDALFQVKYTDIDYIVFSDAADHVANGRSPYARDTYRYTPLLAWLLTPNTFLHHDFGKVLFSVCDLLVAGLIYRLVCRAHRSETLAKYSALVWLYNPVTIAVSTRGNSESLVTLLVLVTLDRFWVDDVVMSGVLYGLAVHFKIYPVIYSFPMYCALQPVEQFRDFFKPNLRVVKWVLSTGISFLAWTALAYCAYGQEFLDEAVFFHVTRTDVRHNFSVYFYLLYLWAENPSQVLSLLLFVPQIVAVVSLGWQYKAKGDLLFAIFTQTMAFVTFNKVVTSQYFLWYLALLPLCLPAIKMSVKEAGFLLGLWYLGQGLWLYPAYLLEFEKQDTFVYIWLAGLLFFAINIFVLSRLRSRYCSPKLSEVKEKD